MPGITLDLDAGGAAGVDLLGRAAEDQRIAALQAHDVLAGERELDHQRVDLGLLARGAVAGLADGHAAGLAPREFEDSGADEVVVEDHRCRLQRADRLQRQQLGISGSRAHQSDPALRLRRRFEQHLEVRIRR